MSEDKNTENEIVASLALAASEHRFLDEKHPYVILGEDQRIQNLDYLRDAPSRIKADFKAESLESFIAYIEKFKNLKTALFCSQKHTWLRAIIDYHANNSPSWATHHVAYAPELSPQWKNWIFYSAKWFSQESFANFIENNLSDIVQPSGAELLEIASSLEAKKSTDFKSAIRLKDGTSELSFMDTLQTKVAVPAKIILGISPFENSRNYMLSARLRYRIKENDLEFCYLLDRPEKILEEEFKSMLMELESQTGIEPYLGTA